MNRRLRRRRLLSLLCFSPLAAVAPAVALPKPDKPKTKAVENLTIKIDVDSKDYQAMLKDIRREVDRQVILSLRNAKCRGFA